MTQLDGPDGEGAGVVRRPPFGDNPVVGERGASTQRRILGAALDVLGEVGFHEARVELITERAGCSRPSFYQYFSSKDDVFWALAGQLGREMVELADRLGPITADATGVEALRRWLDQFADLSADYAPVFAAFQAAIRNQEPIARGSRSISDRLGRELIRRAGSGHPELEVDRLASTLVTMLIRTNFYWRGFGDGLSRERFVDGLAHTVHRLLMGPITGVNVGTRAGSVRPGPRGWPETPDGAPDRTLRPRGQRTRQKLLDAGAAVLPARGYHDTRVDDIVAAAGVSHGSFYRYFENKDYFFRALAEQAIGDLQTLLDSFPAATDPDALRAWLEVWFSTYRENGGIISAWQEIEFSDPQLRDFSEEVAASVFERLVHVVDRRGFGDSLVDGLALLALIERVPYSVFTLGYSAEPEAIEATIVIIRRGLLGVDDADASITA